MSFIKSKKLLMAASLIAVLSAGGMFFQYGPYSQASAQGAPGEMPAMPVPAIKVEQKPVQIWKNFSGRLMAVDYVEIRPQVSGIIEKVNFQDGQIVKAGDVLFNIDPRPYEAAVASARAEVASAQQDLIYAQKQYERAEQLLKTGAISQQGYDAQVNSQKNNKSAISAANARLKAALVDLDHAAIKAPIGGRISRAEITEGNLVKASDAPLLTTIVSDKEIYADFEVDDQTYLTFVRAKNVSNVASEQEIPVELKLKDDDKKYTGKIKSFDNKINPTSGTIRVRAVFANDDNALLPGMFASVRIGSVSKENVITVPEKAILTDQSHKFVYVVMDGTATYRAVVPGETLDNERIILEGLQPGDQVIVDNLMKLRPGAKVQAMSQEELDAMKAQMAAQMQGGGAPPAEAPKKEEKKAEENATDAAAPAEQPAAQPTEMPAEPAKEEAKPAQE